ncbi:MAG: hypothetical protein HKL90_02205 [Elusimicrobia bacterium]|nr:hypothetical protein [Elusimicrobiota bacterium]
MNRIDWPAVARKFGLFAAFVICCVPIADPDLPWHLAVARRIIATGAVPRHDFLSWTMAGRPWIDFEWGAEIIFRGLECIGGGVALWMFRAASLFLVTFLLVGLLRLWKVPRSWDGFVAPAFAAALFPAFGLRTEVFSLIFLLLEFQALERRRLGVLGVDGAVFAAWHIPFYAVWANLHAGFPAGLVICFCYGIGELRTQPDGTVPWSGLSGILGAAGTLFNPYGAGVWSVLVDHWKHLDMMRQLIQEWWTPSFLFDFLTGYWVAIAFAFAGILLILSKGYALPDEHVAILLIFGYLGSRSVRSTRYALLTVFPIGVAAWSNLKLSRRSRGTLAFAAAAAICFSIWRGLRVGTHAFRLDRSTMQGTPGPEGVFAFLEKEKSTLSDLKLYNPYNWGGTFDARLFPDYRMFIDGRYIFIELLSQVDKAYRAPTAWWRFVAEHEIDLAVVENDGLILHYPWEVIGRPYSVYAWPRKEWALVYWDRDALVLVRRTAVQKGWLAAHEFKWLGPRDLHHTGLLIVGGQIRLEAVEAEIARYHREIGDPGEARALDDWLIEFKKGLRRVGRWTPPSSRKSFSPPEANLLPVRS